MSNKFYITTSVAYANAAPHMGHAYEAFLVDCIARYKRLRGVETFFLTGTDEHGDKIIRGAKEKGLGLQAFVDENVEKFKDLFEALDISYDFFIRTTDKKVHWPGVQTLWGELLAAGDVYKDKYSGLYCVGCEAFITDKDLEDGKCPNHGVAPEKIEEENYFFRLSKYTDILKEKIKSDEFKIFPISRKNEILALLEAGLRDVSISRPEGGIPWGVPVPNEKGHMMYVWFEALVNYISALGYGRDDNANFEKFWPADVHLIGKDIIRFHTALWPAMLLSAKLPLPKKIVVHGFITSGGKKMSKTLGNVVDPKDVVLEFGSEALRYYLAREVTPTEDGDFTMEKFLEAYNANLANGLGNLTSRVLVMAQQYFNGEVLRGSGTDVPLKKKLETVSEVEEIEGFSIPHIVQNTLLPKYFEYMDNLVINKAADVVWELIGTLDGYITDYEPFKLIKEDKKRTENIIWNLLYGLVFVSKMLEPFMPKTAKEINVLLGGISFDDKNEPMLFNIKVPESQMFARK
jgi:methionyl-tRNA synthetase